MKLAALVLVSVAAFPAAARDRAAPKAPGDYSLTARAAAAAKHPARRDMRYHAPALSDHLYAAAPPQVGMPIIDNIDVGVGLYSVHGAKVRDRDFRRLEPVSEIRSGGKSASSRVAAVGMSVRF